jgi:hypothetical protein
MKTRNNRKIRDPEIPITAAHLSVSLTNPRSPLMKDNTKEKRIRYLAQIPRGFPHP